MQSYGVQLPVVRVARTRTAITPQLCMLSMLQTEEGQRDAVFACFGSAAQRAQYFEAALKDFLSQCNRIQSDVPSIADLDTQDHNLQKKTMGALLALFRKRVDISDDVVLSIFLKAVGLEFAILA